MEGKQTKAIRCALYCRVSRLLGQSVQNQITPLTEFANNRGYRIVGTYSDEGQSGGKTKRPQLDAMLRDAKAGKFDVLAVVALDRLGRDLKHLLLLLDELRTLNVQFVSLRENISDSGQGRLFLSLIGAICEFERNLIRTRIKEAIASRRMLAQQTGTHFKIGRPSLLNNELIQRIVDLRNNEGMSIRSIETAIGKKVSRGTIERVLKAHREGCHDKLIKNAPKNRVISIPENQPIDAASDPEKTTDIVTPLTAKGGRR